MRERPMIISMPTTARPQQRYDHRLHDLVQCTRDVTIATDLGVPRSTARGWLGKAPTVVVSLDVTDLRAPELLEEILRLRRRVKKLTALVGFNNLITPPGRTREPRHRDGRDDGHEPRATPCPAAPADVPGRAA